MEHGHVYDLTYGSAYVRVEKQALSIIGASALCHESDVRLWI